jgi:hypothetical protein
MLIDSGPAYHCMDGRLDRRSLKDNFCDGGLPSPSRPRTGIPAERLRIGAGCVAEECLVLDVVVAESLTLEVEVAFLLMNGRRLLRHEPYRATRGLILFPQDSLRSTC